MFRSCATDPRGLLGIRDAAILAIMYGTGGRASETVALNLADYAPAEGVLLVREGKGRKARKAFLNPQGQEALQAWLRVRGQEPGPLFPRMWRNGTLTLQRLGRRGLLAILHKRAQYAGVRPFGCHDLRRSTVTDLLTAGVDLNLVRQVAGHASVTITQRYDKRPETAQQEAMRALKIPVQPPTRAPDHAGRQPQPPDQA